MEDYGGGGYCSSKRSGQIPAFGDWDYTDDLPITQYFETARQAGLINRYSSSSGECGGEGSDDINSHRRGRSRGYNKDDVAPTRRQARGSGDALRKTRPTTTTTDTKKQRSLPQVTGSDHFPMKKQSVRRTTTAAPAMHANGYYDDDKDNANAVTEYPRPTTMPARATRASAKPVDEDLYKISPDLLRTTKRKKMLGFFSRCLVPCTA